MPASAVRRDKGLAMKLLGSMVLLDSIDNVLRHLGGIMRGEVSIYQNPYTFLKDQIKAKNIYDHEQIQTFRQLYFNSIQLELFNRYPKMVEDIFNEVINRYNNENVSTEQGTKNAQKDYSRYNQYIQLPQVVELRNFMTDNLNLKDIPEETLFSLSCSLYILSHAWLSEGLRTSCENSYEKYVARKLDPLRDSITHPLDIGSFKRVSEGVYKIKYKYDHKYSEEDFNAIKIFECLDELSFFGQAAVRSLAYLRIDSIIHNEIKIANGNILERKKISLE